jgi:hypothetical protein
MYNYPNMMYIPSSNYNTQYTLFVRTFIPLHYTYQPFVSKELYPISLHFPSFWFYPF